MDPQRAEAGDPDPRVPIGDRQPLGEGHGRVLRDRVGGRSDLRQEPGGRGGLQEISPSPGEHAGQDGAGGIDVGHHVHVPDAPPFGVGRLDAPGERDPRIGAEEVDRPEGLRGPLHQAGHIRLDPDVRRDGKPADLPGDRGGPARVEIGDDHAPGTFRREPSAEGAADAVGPPGDHRHLVSKLHDILPDEEGCVSPCRAVATRSWRWSPDGPRPARPPGGGCGPRPRPRRGGSRR